jgi:hypothetical protein
MAKKHWISKAVPPSHRGVFSDKAKDAGMSTSEYADKEKGAPGALGGEARLAKTLMRMNKKKKG